MLKELALISMLFTSAKSDYVKVDEIEYLQTNDSDKKITFNFESDYFSTHLIEVKISLYDSENNYLCSYQNELDIIGKRSAIANFSYHHDDHVYAMIDVMYKNAYLIYNAKINFYLQDNCNVTKKNTLCNFIYKSEYVNGVSRDLYSNFRVKKDSFDTFLPFNKFNVKDVSYYSNYEFTNSDIYLVINENIDNYNVEIFPIGVENGNFILMNNYYVNLMEFRFEEDYFENSIRVNEIYFPYSSEYKEYHCSIVIDDIIEIQIDFSVATSDLLYGECEHSKYCLTRYKYA